MSQLMDDREIIRPHKRRADDEVTLSEQVSMADEYKAAFAMLLVMGALVGAWLLGAGWRP